MDRSNYKIFLSHSGEQSWPVTYYLYHELSKSYDDSAIFFDKESLKPGDSITPGILNIIQNGEIVVGVVIISHDFVRKKWPMVELEYLVDAMEKRKKDVHSIPLTIMPIFCDFEPGKLTDSSFIEELRREYWDKMGDCKNTSEKTLPFNIENWKPALQTLKTTVGITGEHILKQRPITFKELGEKLKPLVSRICEIYPPLLCSFSNDLVFYAGCERMANEVHEQLECIREQSQEESVITLGVYGAAGSGKTTFSKTMVDFYKKMGYMNGMAYKDRYRMSYCLKLPSENKEISLVEELKTALKELTSASDALLLQIRDIENAIRILKERMKVKVFLSIDNVREWNRIYVADILRAMNPGSTVMVTSRSIHALKFLNLKRIICVPIMAEDEPWKAFLRYMNLPASWNCESNEKLKNISKQLYSFLDGCHPELLFHVASEAADRVERSDQTSLSDTIRNLIGSEDLYQIIKGIVMSALNMNDLDTQTFKAFLQRKLPHMNILIPANSDVHEYNCICTWSDHPFTETKAEAFEDEKYMLKVPVFDQVDIGDEHNKCSCKIVKNEVEELENVDKVLRVEYSVIAKCCGKEGQVWGIHRASHEVQAHYKKKGTDKQMFGRALKSLVRDAA